MPDEILRHGGFVRKILFGFAFAVMVPAHVVTTVALAYLDP